MRIFIALWLLCGLAQAQEKPLKLIEVDLADDIRIAGQASDTGIEQIHDTGADNIRGFASYHINGNPLLASEVTSYDLGLGFRYGLTWVELIASKLSGRFENLTETNPSQSPTESLLSTDEDLTSLGVGIGYKWGFLREWLGWERVFERTTAYGTMNWFTENEFSESYSGPGLKTDFAVLYRSSSAFHYGAKFSYNLALVKRSPAFEGEPRSWRSLELSWVTWAFEIGVYF